MNFLQMLDSLLGAGGDAKPSLSEWLAELQTKAPDLVPTEILDKLNAAVPPDAAGLVGELKEFLATHKLNPRQHPSDLAG